MEQVLTVAHIGAAKAGRTFGILDRLARRIAGFPPHAVAAAKAAVLRAEKEVVDDLMAEGDAFSATLGHPDTVAALAAFMDRGGQTREGELRLGDLAGELPAG